MPETVTVSLTTKYCQIHVVATTRRGQINKQQFKLTYVETININLHSFIG